jgi:hypothetical protein
MAVPEMQRPSAGRELMTDNVTDLPVKNPKVRSAASGLGLSPLQFVQDLKNTNYELQPYQQRFLS